jgi:glyoxylase-like metal-dependent hydrolase (beta-lactamase superfamily II)
MFLLEDRFLFTGDSLFWSRGPSTLHTHRAQCWSSWPTQRTSLSTLADLSFEWVLPGHGGRINRAASELRQHLTQLLERMPQPDWKDVW